MKRGALLSFAFAALLACKRTPEPTTDAGAAAATTAANTPPAPGAAPAAAGGNGFDPASPAPRELPTVEGPTDPYVLEVGVEAVPGAPAPAAPKADPFEASIASVRSSSVGCFAGLPPGDYSATVSVFVTPSGVASTVTVVSGPSDEAVRKCLVQAATRSYPASKDGRKLSVDVSVKG